MLIRSQDGDIYNLNHIERIFWKEDGDQDEGGRFGIYACPAGYGAQSGTIYTLFRAETQEQATTQMRRIMNAIASHVDLMDSQFSASDVKF